MNDSFEALNGRMLLLELLMKLPPAEQRDGSAIFVILKPFTPLN